MQLMELDVLFALGRVTASPWPLGGLRGPCTVRNLVMMSLVSLVLHTRRESRPFPKSLHISTTEAPPPHTLTPPPRCRLQGPNAVFVLCLAWLHRCCSLVFASWSRGSVCLCPRCEQHLLQPPRLHSCSCLCSGCENVVGTRRSPALPSLVG